MKSSKIQEKKSISDLFQLIPYLKLYKTKITLVVISLIVTSTTVLLLGKIIKHLIDFGIVNNNNNHLNLILISFIFAVIILAIASYFRSALINEVGENIIAILRQKIYRHIISISSEFFQNNKIGDIISRLTVDTTLLYNIISNSVSFLLRNILLFFGGLTLLFFSSTKLTLVALLLIPIAIVPIIILGKKVKKLSLKTQEKVADLGSHIEESINGILTIQAYQNEMEESNNFDKLSVKALNISVKKIKIRALLISLIILIAFLFVGIVIWLGIMEVIQGNMSAGDLSSFVFYAVITATSLIAISQVMGQLQTASASAQRLFELLKAKSPIKELKKPIKLPNNVISGEKLNLELKNIHFSYKSRQKTLILEDFSLKIAHKEKIALVGPSGAGKTTIFQLLMRFFDVNKGQILVNGKFDTKKLALKELRSLFSYISQDCFIFSGTVFSNILRGAEYSKRSQIQALINSNKAFDFINKLPNGLDCHIGQKGVKLSGGERQRIAILRAIVNDAPILLLDEATSALDNKNEQLIADLINNLMKNKMVIFIAHRLSTIKHVDRIIFMQDGKVIEKGSHKELIKKNGSYKEMIKKDFESNS